MLTSDNKKLPARDWLLYFGNVDKLNQSIREAPSAHAKSIKIGRFLSTYVGRPVPIQVNGRNGTATLRTETKTHGQTKLYYFEVVWDAPEVEEEPAHADIPTTAKKGEKASAPAAKVKAKKKAQPKPSTSKASNAANSEQWD